MGGAEVNPHRWPGDSAVGLQCQACIVLRQLDERTVDPGANGLDHRQGVLLGAEAEFLQPAFADIGQDQGLSPVAVGHLRRETERLELEVGQIGRQDESCGVTLHVGFVEQGPQAKHGTKRLPQQGDQGATWQVGYSVPVSLSTGACGRQCGGLSCGAGPGPPEDRFRSCRTTADRLEDSGSLPSASGKEDRHLAVRSTASGLSGHMVLVPLRTRLSHEQIATRSIVMRRVAIAILLAWASAASAAEKVVWQIGKPDRELHGVRHRRQLSGLCRAVSRQAGRVRGRQEPPGGRTGRSSSPGPTDSWAGSRVHPLDDPLPAGRRSRGACSRSGSNSSTCRAGSRRVYAVTHRRPSGRVPTPARRRRRLADQPPGRQAAQDRGPLPAAMFKKGDQRDRPGLRGGLVGPVRRRHAARTTPRPRCPSRRSRASPSRPRRSTSAATARSAGRWT